MNKEIKYPYIVIGLNKEYVIKNDNEENKFIEEAISVLPMRKIKTLKVYFLKDSVCFSGKEVFTEDVINQIRKITLF